MSKLKYKYIAIDFDGTIADDAFPELGKMKPFADMVIREIKRHGGQIAIWTCRTDEHVENVKKFLADHMIPYDVFNESFPEIAESWGGDKSRKIFADRYIDDRSIHCDKIDWLEIASRLFEY